MKKSYSIFLAIVLLIGGCENEKIRPGAGPVNFSFRTSGDDRMGGKVKEHLTPAFVSYTLKKSDGSSISNKIELYAFNGDFVTQPQQLAAGPYQLEQFLVLDADNKTIYVSPLAGSALADLVEHPLPLSFNVSAEEVTNVVPEVVAVGSHTPEEFGYVAFGFEVIEKFDLNVNATIADHAVHPSIDYTMEVIAKDAPLGNVKWTKTIPFVNQGTIHVPAKYAHYTFKAVKAGYISHVQHFMADELSEYSVLSFEFIPESLDGFLMYESDVVKIYSPNQQNRCKLYTRFDVAEGYFASMAKVQKSVKSKGGLSLGVPMKTVTCYPGDSQLSLCGRAVNIFDNKPFAEAQDYCSEINLPIGSTHTLDDVNVDALMILSYKKAGQPDSFKSHFMLWKGANNP